MRSESLSNLPLKPPHPQTHHPHAQITCLRRCTGEREILESILKGQFIIWSLRFTTLRAVVSAQTTSRQLPDWLRTNEDSQRGLQPQHRAPARSSDVFPNQLQDFHMPLGASSPLQNLTRRLHSWGSLRVQRPLG